MTLSRTYRLAKITNPVGHGVTGSVVVEVNAIAKKNSDANPYCVANEYICAYLGGMLGLPVAPVSFISHSGPDAQTYVASLDFNLAGEALPPVEASDCITHALELSTGLIIFDVLIANQDRHRGNLSLDLSKRPPQLDIFDHSHALFGNKMDFAKERLQTFRDNLGIVKQKSCFVGNRHCLLDHINSGDHFKHWIDRVKQIPSFVIDDLCDKVIGLGPNAADIEEAKSFLKYRTQNMNNILRDGQTEFSSIAQLSLFL